MPATERDSNTYQFLCTAFSGFCCWYNIRLHEENPGFFPKLVLSCGERHHQGIIHYENCSEVTPNSPVGNEMSLDQTYPVCQLSLRSTPRGRQAAAPASPPSGTGAQSGNPKRSGPQLSLGCPLGTAHRGTTVLEGQHAHFPTDTQAEGLPFTAGPEVSVLNDSSRHCLVWPARPQQAVLLARVPRTSSWSVFTCGS